MRREVGANVQLWDVQGAEPNQRQVSLSLSLAMTWNHHQIPKLATPVRPSKCLVLPRVHMYQRDMYRYHSQRT